MLWSLSPARLTVCSGWRSGLMPWGLREDRIWPWRPTLGTKRLYCARSSGRLPPTASCRSSARLCTRVGLRVTTSGSAAVQRIRAAPQASMAAGADVGDGLDTDIGTNMDAGIGLTARTTAATVATARHIRAVDRTCEARSVGRPRARAAAKPPTRPPMWAYPSMCELENPMSRLIKTIAMNLRPASTRK